MKYGYKLLAAALAACLVSGAQAAGDSLEQLKQKLLKKVQPMEDVTVTATPVEGFYAARFANPRYATIYFDRELTIVKNGYGAGWYAAANARKLDEAEETAINKRLLARLPLDKAIRIPGKTSGAVLVERSAVDCPYCRIQEGKLAAQGVTWYVFPGHLSPENRAMAVNVYCSEDPAGAWLALMVDKKTPPRRPDCGYPDDDFRDIADLVGRGSPVAFFRSGTIVRGEREERLQPAIREAIAQKNFF